ncbi:MAG: hypothetical protein ACSLFN_11370 [Candidatus Limnocylindrales bacterium]
MAGKRRKGRPIGETLGGIIVGFDQQIFRTLPPPHELVQKGAPVRGISGDDGGTFELVFPDEGTPADLAEAPDPAAPTDEPPEP